MRTYATYAEAVPEIVQYEMLDYARAHGGCPRTCRFVIGVYFSARDLEHVVTIEHNERDRHEIAMEPLAMMAPSCDVRRGLTERAEPWLRGLHRFGPESGIK